MPTPFVILFEGRSGSTHLMRLLDSHHRIRVWPEKKLTEIKRNGGTSQEQLQWAHRHQTLPANGSLDAIGFKAKVRDVIDPPAFASLLEDRDSRVVHLERENLVKLAISSINAQRLAQATSRFNLLDEADRLPPTSIDLAVFQYYLEQREAWQLELARFVAGLDRPCVRITYEDLLRDERRVLAGIWSFLDVDPAPVRSSVLKNTSDDLREAVVNFEELRSHYAGTRYEPMFDEVMVPTSR